MRHPEIQPIVNLRSSRYSKQSVSAMCEPLVKAGLHIRAPITLNSSHSHAEDRVISAVVKEAKRKEEGVAFLVFGGDGTWNTVVHRVNEDVKHAGGEDRVMVAFVPRGEMNVNAKNGFQTGEKLLRAIQNENTRRLAYLDLTIDALHTPSRTAIAFITAGWGPSAGLSQKLENIRPKKNNAVLRALKIGRSFGGIPSGILPQEMSITDATGVLFEGIAAGFELVNVPNLLEVPGMRRLMQSDDVTAFLLSGKTKSSASKNLLLGLVFGVTAPRDANPFLRRMHVSPNGAIDVETPKGIIFQNDAETRPEERVNHVHVHSAMSVVRALVPFCG